MTAYQDQFDALPKGMQRMLREKFEDEVTYAFDRHAAEDYYGIVDDFLCIPEVNALWDAHLNMLKDEWVMNEETHHWLDFLQEAFANEGLNTPED